jgi:hypothetical protein
MGWVVSITPRPRFTPGERTPGTHCTGGWVGPRAGLDTEAIGKILCPRRGSNPDRPVVQSVVRHYTDWANPAPNVSERWSEKSEGPTDQGLFEEAVRADDVKSSFIFTCRQEKLDYIVTKNVSSIQEYVKMWFYSRSFCTDHLCNYCM